MSEQNQAAEKPTEKLICFPPGYCTPPEFQNIPFNDAWLTMDGLPFGMEAWAMEFMRPGDWGAGQRFQPNTPPHEPWTTSFRVKREHDGDVDISYEVSKDEWFSLRPNAAVLVRRGADGRGGITMAKWIPMLTMPANLTERGERVWKKLWERKIVRENVAPLFPATNGAALNYVRDNVYRLAMHYNIPPAPAREGIDAQPVQPYFFFNWEGDVLPSDKKLREAMFKDTRESDNQMLRLVMEFYDMELRLKTNAKDLTPIQMLAEFQAFAFKSKSILALQVAQGLSVRSQSVNPLIGRRFHEE